MSWTERQSCRFEAYPDGEGRPSHLYIDLPDGNPTLLAKKQIGRLFFAFDKDVSWTEANQLVDELNERLSLLCVNHLAADEV